MYVGVRVVLRENVVVSVHARRTGTLSPCWNPGRHGFIRVTWYLVSWSMYEQLSDLNVCSIAQAELQHAHFPECVSVAD